MEEEYYPEEDVFKKQLDSEGLLAMQLNRVAIYRDKNIRQYCSSIETLMLICPRKIRNKTIEHLKELQLIRGKYGSITEEKLVIYDDLLVFINELLEKHKMIWKKREIKTFE
jgi:hypothetical protein